ncbi:MAG: CotH kinase family protein, partial [Phycisphaerae bacterium]
MSTVVRDGGSGPRLESLEPRLLLAADVVISEIMYQSLTDLGRPEDYGEEFIELFNRGDAPADLLGWEFTNGIDFEFPDVSIGIGEYLVVAANPTVFQTIYPTVSNYVADHGWDGHLSNSGELIELEDDTGATVDQVEYADEGDWAVRERLPDPDGGTGYVWSNLHDGGGRSLELINPATTNNCGQNWSASLVDGGTPGVANSVAAADIAPLIRNVEQSPIIPTASEAVTVSAKIQDELATGLAAVLYYRDDGDPTFNTATMYDDGLHNDGDPGDDVYAAEIPERPDGTIVEFYVRATDAGAHSRTWPAPVAVQGQVANCLYQVDDSFTQDWTPGSQPVWRVVLTAAEWAYLDNLEDNQRWSNAQMNATFITTDGVSTKVRYEAGMRHRGNGSRTHDPHNQRINIPHDRPWQGYTAVTMNTQRTHSQIIGSAVFRYADIPAADATAVKFLINGTDYADAGADMYGHYVALEALDSDLVDNHWPDDGAGDLYKCNDSNGPAAADLDYDGENPDNYNIAYVKQTNVAADDYSGLIHMLYVLNEAPEETYLQDVAEAIDIEQWVRFLAVDTLLANGEGGLTDGRGDDYAMYQGVEDPRFTLVPYDLDTVLGTGTQSQTNDDIWEYRDPSLHGLERLLSQPEVAQMYYAQLLELCDTVFAPETINPLIDQALAWAPAAIRQNMKTFAAQRVANVRGQVANDPLSAQTSLPVSGGYPRTTSAAVGLSGTASGAYTRSVLVNGRVAEWDPETGNWWFNDSVGGYEEQTLVFLDAAVTYYVPTAADAGLVPTSGDPGWTAPGFDDGNWIDSITLEGASVLITEISTGQTRFVEIENVSDGAIDTTGWSVLVNSASGGINAVNSVAWSLPASIASGGVLYQSDDVADHYWGATIDWGAAGPGWAMVIDDGGSVADFLAWGYAAGEIASLDISYGGFAHITVGDQWSGNGAPVGTADTEVPTADVIDISPDPRNSTVSQIQIVFSEAVSGFDLSDLSLARGGGANLLTAEPLTSTDNITWTLGGVAGLTAVSGTYSLTLTASGSNIQDDTGNPLVGDASDTWVTDMNAPTADVTDVVPDPHSTPVSQIQIVFSEAVSGFGLSDLSLTRDGGANLLTAEPLTSSNNVTWTLGGLTGLTSAEGTYTLTLTAAGSGIQDAAGNGLAADASDTWQIIGVAPMADVIDVSPDPRNSSVDEIGIVFTEAVSGFDITDLSLTVNGGADLLTAEPLSSADNITWTLGGLAGLTAADGTYTLTLTAAGSGIQDLAGNPLAGDASDVWLMSAQIPGWVAFNDHVAGTGTHVNATTYAGNGTSGGELKDIDTGLGTGATLTITAAAIVYDNNGADPPNPSDAYSYFNGFVDMSATTGSSIEIEAGLGASYTHTFSSLDTGALATYDFVGAAIRGSNTYTDRWTLITLLGAEAFTSAHSTGDGVVTSAFNPSLNANQVAIWAGDNASPGQGWVARWSDIDPGVDGEFAVVSEQYTG